VTVKNSGQNTAGLRRPWAKGQSGNPKGRPPKGLAFADLLNAALDDQALGKDGALPRALIASAAIRKAMAGDLDAMKWIADRTDGKVKEQHQHDHAGKLEHEHVIKQIVYGGSGAGDRA
jgi:hypothetical protein